MKRFILVLLCLFFVGCGSVGGGGYPSWYVKPPKNDAAKLYGVGYGRDVDSATKRALQNISEQMAVTISSEKKSQQVEAGGKYLDSYNFKVNSKTNSVKFTDYEVVDSQAFSGNIYVLVGVSRDSMSRQYRNDLDINTEKIEKIDGRSRSKPNIDRVVALGEIMDISQNNRQIIDVLHFLDPNFASGPYLESYTKYEHELAKLKNSMTFYIKTNDAFDGKIGAAFRRQLSKNNIIVLDSMNTGALIIDIHSDRTENLMQGNYLVKADVSISLMSRGQIVRSVRRQLVGTSLINYSQAENSAVKSFEADLEKEGVFGFMGLE